jgi:hypothetical protein
MANPEHVELVRKGAEAIAEWRLAHPGEGLDLSEANLSLANLSGANLSLANLSGADLTRAHLREASLIDANLSGADLSRAGLSLANLSGANLGGANLGEASLFAANLFETNLSLANLSGASLGYTSLGNVDLSQARELGTVQHAAPSTVGVDTLIVSYRGAGGKLTPDLRTFFRRAGVPKELLDALRMIVAEVKYYSSFISYGEPDVKFAKRLTKSLRGSNVSCWLYDMDSTAGEPTWREIGVRRREADKMVVLCSSGALVRDGVLKEIEEQIDEDPDKMVPISLDNLWKELGFRVMRGSRDLKPFLLKPNHVDFVKLGYRKGLDRLLKGLEQPAVKRARRSKRPS